MKALLRVATRGSRLALWQAEHVASRLRELVRDMKVELVVVRTAGDLGAPAAPAQRGLFTGELERALQEGAADVAVHSLKDLPTRPGEGLALAAVLEREDPRDALIARRPVKLRDLSRSARVGTSSLRRRAQLLALRPDLQVADLRGNVPTRLQRLDAGEYDSIVLAHAGLRRLGLSARVSELFEPHDLLPAPGQGALAVQARAQDRELVQRLSQLDHAPTRLATTAERALLSALEGGCQVPVGALATFDGGRLALAACVAPLDGNGIVRARAAADVAGESEALALGVRVAEELLERGAAPVLARLRETVSERAAAGVLWEEA
jgi:hydroxymethylbilane synthase